MATHSSILAWKIPRTEEPDGLHTLHGVAESQTRLSTANMRDVTRTIIIGDLILKPNFTVLYDCKSSRIFMRHNGYLLNSEDWRTAERKA